MAFQGTFDKARGQYTKVTEILGADLIGTKVHPPFGMVKEVYVLPMEGVLATKVSHHSRPVPQC
jgi:leucyl-tRNA synthetase